MEEVTEKDLERSLAEFIHNEEHTPASNPPHYNAARALLAAGLIDREALSRLSGSR
ncbi:hypothetical protein OG432_24295 [Streptomyces sp. NBC_00442]|uniref:hypothetical protein n=1 Tax=Streptomyces sp. NBC_00442 TaxID=2903651 RepID=UPI002E24EFC0